MIIHRSLRLHVARRNTLAACLAATFAAGGAGAAGPTRAPQALASSDEAIFGALHTKRAYGAGEKARSSALWSIPTAPTQPADITVQNCDDSGPGSLRQAFADAVDGDAIGFSPTLPCSTITLTTGAIDVAAPNLTLQGPGQDNLIVDGNDTDRVLAAPKYSLAISDITIANGFADDGLGGCIDLLTGDLTLTRTKVTGCRAGDGATSRSLGGGVYVGGSLILRSSTISNSSVTANGPSYGGGAYVVASASLHASTIASNAAMSESGEVNGGGLAVKGNVLVYDSQVLDNHATSIMAPAYGGGLWAGGSIDATLLTVSGNTADSASSWIYGGGIHGAAFGSGALITLAASTLSGNTASSSCASCSIAGGGISAFGPIHASYSTIRDNHILSAPGSAGIASGGGLATLIYETGQIVLTNSTVSGNSAIGGDNGGTGYGGGFSATDKSPFLVFNSTVAFNEASHFGGGGVGSVAGANVPSLSSTIVANNQAPTSADLAPGTPFTPFELIGSNNLVVAPSVLITLPNDTISSDPILLPLADNGGPTATHALSATSPAIDAGINTVPASFDQRFCPNVRESGGIADIGAFELQIELNDFIFGNGFDGGLPACP
jgi:hypothetical protein